MNSQDVVAVIQTHNSKGESCGVRVLVQDLNEEIQKQLDGPEVEKLVRALKSSLAQMKYDWGEDNSVHKVPAITEAENILAEYEKVIRL